MRVAGNRSPGAGVWPTVAATDVWVMKKGRVQGRVRGYVGFEFFSPKPTAHDSRRLLRETYSTCLVDMPFELIS